MRHTHKEHTMKITRHTTPYLLAALLLLGLSACDKPWPAQEAGRKLDEAAEKATEAVKQSVDDADDAAERQKEKASTAMEDTEITAKVKTALMQREGMKSVTISVKTRRGLVTLTGSVASQAQADVAQQLAQAVKGVHEVDNLLVVVSPANASGNAR